MADGKKFIPYKGYIDNDYFKKKLDDGYREVLHGFKTWASAEDIIVIWAFYGKDGKIPTLHYPVKDMIKCTTGEPFEVEYTKSEFLEFVRKENLTLERKKHRIEDIIKSHSAKKP